MPSPPLSSPRSNAEFAVRAVDVTKSYGTAAALIYALRRVTLDVRHGERVALLGDTSAGGPFTGIYKSSAYPRQHSKAIASSPKHS